MDNNTNNDKQQAGSNTIAILALVFSFVFAPIGLILSIVALSKKQSKGLAISALVISILGILSVLMLLGGLFAAGDAVNKELSKSPTTKVEESKKFNIGEPIDADGLEVTIDSVEEKTSVGGQYVEKTPADGGVFVAVKYSLKNTSKEPISSFSTTTFNLVDTKNDVKYDSDIDASATYSTEIDPNDKILSDLNPGIKVQGAKVFEISKELYDQGTWVVSFSRNGVDYTVAIK